MPTSTIRISTGSLIGLNRFVDMEPCNWFLPRDMNKHIKWTSGTVGTLPIIILTTCHKKSHFSVPSSALKSESSISKPSLSVGRAALRLAKSSLPVLPPLSPQLNVKPEFMGPQNRHDGKHLDSIVKDFRALLGNTQDAMHRVAIYSGTGEFIKQKSRKQTYIQDEQLHTMELCIFRGIKVEVEGLHGERISQMCRSTGSQSWGGGDRRNNSVWAKQRPGRCYGMQNGPLPWQLQRLS